MAEPLTAAVLSALLLHYLEDVVLHVVGGEAHEQCRELRKWLNERLRDGKLPMNYDLERACQHSLVEAAHAFALALGAEMRPKLPWVQAIQYHWRAGKLGQTPLLEIRNTPEGKWLEELDKAL